MGVISFYNYKFYLSYKKNAAGTNSEFLELRNYCFYNIFFSPCIFFFM